MATALAAVVAIVAMRSWRTQEKHKAFQKYKMSLEVFRIELTILPDNFSNLHNSQHTSSNDRYRNDAIKSFARCSESWAGYCVYQISENERKVWGDLFNASNNYLYSGRGRAYVQSHIAKAQKIEFETFWDRLNKDLGL